MIIKFLVSFPSDVHVMLRKYAHQKAFRRLMLELTAVHKMRIFRARESAWMDDTMFEVPLSLPTFLPSQSSSLRLPLGRIISIEFEVPEKISTRSERLLNSSVTAIEL